MQLHAMLESFKVPPITGKEVDAFTDAAADGSCAPVLICAKLKEIVRLFQEKDSEPFTDIMLDLLGSTLKPPKTEKRQEEPPMTEKRQKEPSKKDKYKTKAIKLKPALKLGQQQLKPAIDSILDKIAARVAASTPPAVPKPLGLLLIRLTELGILIFKNLRWKNLSNEAHEFVEYLENNDEELFPVFFAKLEKDWKNDSADFWRQAQ